MSNFSINVQINLGVTPELTALVMAVLQNRPVEKQLPAPTAEEPASDKQTAEEKPSVKRGRKPKEAPATEKEEPSTDVSEEAEKPAPELEPEKEPAPEEKPTPANEPRELTNEDVREAMHRARQRVEGENYKDEPGSEGYIKYHKLMGATFKEIAKAVGGYEKPSEIDTQEGRAKFIEIASQIYLSPEGEILYKVPF